MATVGQSQWTSGVTHNAGETYWHADPLGDNLEYAWERKTTGTTAATFDADRSNYHRLGPRDWCCYLDLVDSCTGTGGSPSTVADWGKAFSRVYFAHNDEGETDNDYRDSQNLNPGYLAPSSQPNKCVFVWNHDDGQLFLSDDADYFAFIVENTADEAFKVERQLMQLGPLAAAQDPEFDGTAGPVPTGALEGYDINRSQYAAFASQIGRVDRVLDQPNFARQFYPSDESLGIGSNRSSKNNDHWINVETLFFEGTLAKRYRGGDREYHGVRR